MSPLFLRNETAETIGYGPAEAVGPEATGGVKNTPFRREQGLGERGLALPVVNKAASEWPLSLFLS